MKRKLAVTAAILAGILVLAGAAIVLWLGAGALLWSARAVAVASEQDDLLSRLPDENLSLLVDARPDEILASPIASAVRPELTVLARLHGVELDLIEGHVDHVVAGSDATGRTVSLGGGVLLSPLLLAPLSPRWSKVEDGSLEGVTDGLIFLAPLEPGHVAATRREDAAWAAEIFSVRAGGEADHRLGAAGGGAPFRADLRIDAAVVRSLGEDLPAEVESIVEGLDRIRFAARTGETLDVELQLVHHDEEAAAAGQQLFFQLNAMAQLVRRAGPLGGMLGAQVPPELLELARDMPDIGVTRSGPIVFLRASIDEPLLERWLQRAIDDAEARLASQADAGAGDRAGDGPPGR